MKAFRINPKTKPRRFAVDLIKEVFSKKPNKVKDSSIIKTISEDENMKNLSELSMFARTQGLSIYDKRKSKSIPTKVIHQYRKIVDFKYYEHDMDVDFNRQYLKEGDLISIRTSIHYDTLNKKYYSNTITFDFKTNKKSSIPASVTILLTQKAVIRLSDGDLDIENLTVRHIANIRVWYGYYKMKSLYKFSNSDISVLIKHNLHDVAFIQWNRYDGLDLEYYIEGDNHCEDDFNSHNSVLEYKLNRME